MAEQVVRACNAKPVTVHTTIDVGGRDVTVVDVDATAAEQLCRDNLTEALQVWCWADPDRATPAGRPLQPAVQPVPGRAVGRLASHPARPGRRLHPPPAPKGRRVAHPRLRRPRRADGPRRRRRQDRGDDHRRPRDPPHRPHRRHRPVRRPRQPGRTTRPRLPAALSHRARVLDAARRHATRRGAPVRRPARHRPLRRRDLLPQPPQDDPAVPRRRTRGARAAPGRLRDDRSKRHPFPLRGETVGQGAGAGTAPGSPSWKKRRSRTRPSPTSTGWASGCSSSTKPTWPRTSGSTRAATGPGESSKRSKPPATPASTAESNPDPFVQWWILLALIVPLCDPPIREPFFAAS